VLYVNSVNQDTYNFFGISAKRRVAFEMSKVEEECQLKWVGSHGIRYQASQHRMYEVAAVNFANTLAFFLEAGTAEVGGSLLTLHSAPAQFLDRRFHVGVRIPFRSRHAIDAILCSGKRQLGMVRQQRTLHVDLLVWADHHSPVHICREAAW
jgi:hypothetical protein